MSEQVEIQLRHVESPSSFFFYFERDVARNRNHGRDSRNKIAVAISQYACNNKNHQGFVPTVDSIIGYFHMRWMTWLRGRVESRLPDGSFKLFLLDFGHHLTTESSEFTDLPDVLKEESMLIKRGSLGLKPCEKVHDRHTGSFVTQPVRGWNKKATEFAKSFDTSSRYETMKFFLVLYKVEDDGTHVGDVIVRTVHDTVSIGERLIADGYAIREEGLVPQVPLSATSMPIANFEKIFSVLHRNQLQTVASKPETKPQAILPAGINVNAYMIDQEKARKSKPAPQQSSSRQAPPLLTSKESTVAPIKAYKPPPPRMSSNPPLAVPVAPTKAYNPPLPCMYSNPPPALQVPTAKAYDPKPPHLYSNPPPALQVPTAKGYNQPSPCLYSTPPPALPVPTTKAYNPPSPDLYSNPPPALAPRDILVYGERLISPLQSIEAAQFRKSIKVKLKEREMSKVESHCWSQISNGRSMVIIASGTLISDERFYAPPIMESVKKSQEQNDVGPCLGPVAIIIAKTSSEAEKIAKFCSQLVDGLTIVVASGPADKKVELMNGCDLLVSTPAAFCRLVEGVSTVKSIILDKDRIKHLVFHRIDTMIKPFESEVNAIIRTCTKGRDKTETNPQIIVTSPRWQREIRTKLMSLMHPKNMVVCVEEFMEAAALVSCGVVMVSLSDVEGKKKKLTETLEKEAYKSERTVVVTNDEGSSKALAKYLKATAVHADEKNCESVKTDWLKQREGSYSVLVVADAVLKRMELRNVQNLIHFTLPPKWDRFSHRHAALLDHFYAVLEKKSTRKPSTTIYLDDDHVDEFSALVKFLQSRHMVDVPPGVLETVKLIKHQEEIVKCEKNIPICSRIWCLGECSMEGCPSRHIFTEADRPLTHLPVQTSVKFTLISLQQPTRKSFFGPTSYIVKIQSHMKESDWCSWEERNTSIEKFLDNDLQEFYKSTSNQKRVAVKFGETYAVMTGNKWHRCQVMEINPSLSPVYLIDSGVDVRCSVKDIFELPDEFKKVEPLVCKLQIVNLVPFDGEESWEQLIKEDHRRELQESTIGCIFTCKVQMAIQDMLFAESFDAKDNQTGSLKCQLKKDLLKKYVCSIDGNVSGKLRKLAVDGNVFQIRKAAEHGKNPEDTALDTSNETQWIQESWKFLSCESYYEVFVKDFKNPESFLVVLDAADKKTQKITMKEIENCATKSPLKAVEVGAICAVRREKVYRGKIMIISGDVVKTLLVDFGQVVQCQRSELFELPQDLVTKLTLQTIHCRLIGLRPKFKMDTWPPKQNEAVRQLIQSCTQPLKVYVAKTSEKKVEEWDKLGMNHYDVILIDPQTGELLADVAVKKGFADSVKYRKPSDLEEFLDSGNASGGDADGPSDKEILQRMLEANMFGDEEDENYDDQIENAEKEILQKKVIVQPEEIAEGSVASSLNYINKHPKIEWRQNDTVVYLLISAVDCEDYGLKIDDSSVTITINYKDRFEKATIELYSLIDPKITSHELRGLNVIVRLVKKTFYNQWPRLTDSELSKERKQFVKYSVERITTELEEKSVNVQQQSSSKYRNLRPESYTDSSDDESLALSDVETVF